MIVGQKELAECLGVTPKYITEWQQRDSNPLPVVEFGGRGRRAQYDVAACVAWRIDEVVRQRVTASADGEFINLDHERARLARAQANKTEIEVSVLRAELIPKEAVARVQGQMISNTRSRVLSLPVKAAPILINRRNENDIKTILTELVHEVLGELAEFSESEYVSERQQAMGATAEADAEPVGGRKAVPKPRGQRRAGPVEH